MFVHYYCSGSGADKGPSYETLLRTLCRRLAWNSDGTLAEPALRLYKSSESIPDAQLTVRSTWEPLFHELIASHLKTCSLVFVLDALDECQSIGDYEELLEFLRKLPREPKGPYFLVSSRLNVPVVNYFKDHVQAFGVVQHQTEEDMKSFIGAQIALKKKTAKEENSIFCECINKEKLQLQMTKREAVKAPALLKKLKSALLEHAGGMYVEFQKIAMSIFPSQY